MPKKKKEEKGYSSWSSRHRTYKSFGVDKEQLERAREERTKKTKTLVLELLKLYPHLNATIIEAVVCHGITPAEVKTLKHLNAQARDIFRRRCSLPHQKEEA